MKFNTKQVLPHIFVIVGFILISLIYFHPVLSGKKIYQSDIVQYTGMAKQHIDFREAEGKETYWTNAAFGGMPTYQLGALYPHNYIKKADRILRFLPRPADYLFLYLLSFYILMLVLTNDFKISALGALAFGFSTYLIIILGVGHNAKAHAIAYMPLVLAGIITAFKGKHVLGFLLTAIALALELSANHFQMTYYLLLLVLVLGLVYLIDAVQKKQLPHFFKTILILAAAVLLSVGLNASNILSTQEYVKESTRSKSELTINADGSPKELSSGLDKDYITEYSYGLAETFNLIIPRFMGGGSYEDLGKDSNTYEAFRKLGASPVQALEESRRVPTYWGDQPIVEAPAYIGAVVVFLFVMSLFLVKGRLRWWLVAGTLLSLLLSYGKNLAFLTDLFIDIVPMYNKFRAVSSIQVILELCIPVLAMFGVLRLLNAKERKDEKLKALKFSTAITAGVVLIFLLFKGSLFEFEGQNDAAYIQAYGPDFIEAVKADRMAIFGSDTLRTLILVLVSAGLILGYLYEKLKENYLIAGLAILILFDLVQVDKRYVNSDDFVAASLVERPFQMTAVDRAILQDSSEFRVLDVTTASTRTSFFHNSITGYHAAKMRRYNELYDFHIANNNLEVLNMLNTRYIIATDNSGELTVFDNPDANGNAWFTKEIRSVNSADAEIKILDSLDTKRAAVVNSEHFGDYLKELGQNSFALDSLAVIEVLEYQADYIKYESRNEAPGLAIFSENYYANGWQAYLDGDPVDHIRANYVLRAMAIPPGQHTIEFKFEPSVVKRGGNITLASSVLLILCILAVIIRTFKVK